MVKHIKKKVRQLREPEDVENVQEFKNVIISNKKKFSILKKYIKTIRKICKQIRCEY